MGIWHMDCYRTMHHTQYLFQFQQKNNIDKFLSLCFLFYSIEEVTIASAAFGWIPGGGNCGWWASQAYGHWKAPANSHCTAKQGLQWEQQIHKATTWKQSAAAKTACKVIFSWPEVVSTIPAPASIAKWDEFISAILSFLIWHPSTVFCCPSLTEHLGA